MARTPIILCLLLLVGLNLASAGFFHHALDHLNNEVKKIHVPKFNLPKFDFGNFGGKLKSVEAVGLSWSNCGGPSDIVKINSLSVKPEPLRLPGQIQASFDVTVSQNISIPVSVDLDIKVKKSPFGWIKVPCVDHEGSCTYDDVCPSKPGKDCPPIFAKYGIPCMCPIKEGHYKLPSSTINVDDISVPSFLKNGKFKVRVRPSNSQGQLFCLDTKFSLK